MLFATPGAGRQDSACGTTRADERPDGMWRTQMSARLLVVDEHERIAPTVLSALQRRFKVVRVAHAEEASGGGYDMALIAPGADDQSGLCRRLIEIGAAG